MSMKWIVTLGLLVLVAGSSGALAMQSSPRRFPVIGCDDPRYPYANHYGWSYAPTSYCGTKRGNGVEGIDHTRWRGWGQKQAKGKGYVVIYDQSVEEFSASITAFGFWSTRHFAGTNEYVSTYTKLRVHVLSRRGWRGPLDFTLDVQIQE